MPPFCRKIGDILAHISSAHKCNPVRSSRNMKGLRTNWWSHCRAFFFFVSLGTNNCFVTFSLIVSTWVFHPTFPSNVALQLPRHHIIDQKYYSRNRKLIVDEISRGRCIIELLKWPGNVCIKWDNLIVIYYTWRI